MRFKTMVLTVGLMVAAGLNTSQTRGQELTWKLNTSDQFQATFVQDSDTTTRVDGRTTLTTVATTLVMDWKVLEIDKKNNAVLEQAITAIKLSVVNPAMPEKSIGFDTSSSEKPPKESKKILKQVMPLIGLKFKVTMAPSGEIVSVLLPDATLTAVRALPDSLQIQAMFSQDGMKELLGASAIVLPESTLEPDATWATDRKISNAFGNFSQKRVYTFQGFEQSAGRKVAVFKIATELKQDSTPSTEGAPEFIGFSESGEAKLDIDGGFFKTCESNSTTETMVPYREKKIETEVKNSIRMTIEKK